MGSARVKAARRTLFTIPLRIVSRSRARALLASLGVLRPRGWRRVAPRGHVCPDVRLPDQGQRPDAHFQERGGHQRNGHFVH